MTINSTAATSRPATTNTASRAETQSGSSDLVGAPLLPEPTVNVGDIGEAMATLMIGSAFAQRQTAREVKVKAESAMEEAQKHQIEEMHTAAEEKYTAAQIDAWVQIGAGAATLGAMGLMAAGSIGTGNGDLGQVGKGLTEAMKYGGTDLAKGIGKVASSSKELAADTSSASAKEAEQAASRMKAGVDDSAEDIRATRESVRKALDFLKEYQVAQAQTQLAALRRA